MTAHQSKGNRAFSLVEILVVVVILGILAAVAVPRFTVATDDAKTAAVQSTVAGVRASLASFRTTAVIAGDDPFPTFSQLTDGTTIKFDIPPNPYTGMSAVQSVSRTSASNRSVINADRFGWNYFVDNTANPPAAVFYCNSQEATTAPDGAGGSLDANDI